MNLRKNSLQLNYSLRPNFIWEKYAYNNPTATRIFKEFNEASQKNSLALNNESNPKQAESKLLLEPGLKYRLENSWSFWFYKNSDGNWKDNLLFITNVDYVEEFWSVFNYLKPVGELANGRDYMFFKKGIKPMWEDSKNLDGGRWLHTFDKSKESIKILENCWVNTLLSLIGSQYEEENAFVNGAVVNIRHKFNKLALWTNNQRNTNMQNKIGKRFKRFLNVKSTISFELHKKELLANMLDETQFKEETSDKRLLNIDAKNQQNFNVQNKA